MADLAARVAEVQRAGGSTEAEAASTATDLDALVHGVNATDAGSGSGGRRYPRRVPWRTLDEKFSDRPLIDARLRGTIGQTYRKLGRYERAEPQLEQALEIRERVLGDDHPRTSTP